LFWFEEEEVEKNLQKVFCRFNEGSRSETQIKLVWRSHFGSRTSNLPSIVLARSFRDYSQVSVLVF
jgi:hypothetical protein